MPRVDPDCSKELFEILGHNTSHGFVLTGYFPVGMVPASVISFFDPHALSETEGELRTTLTVLIMLTSTVTVNVL